LDKIEGEYWIRLHYLHPEGITDELISVLSNSKHILPYLDIPLQHISENVLENMNRRINASQIKEVLLKLRKNIPNLVIRTTFLTGFPGESETNFNELKMFVSEWKFERLGVFPFYLEEGTKAAELSNQIPFAVAEKRARVIYDIHADNSRDFNKELEGRELDMIVDVSKPEGAVGRIYMDSPDIDNIVNITTDKKVKEGSIIKIRITGSSEFELIGIEI
jgi:ribosomal protein S12 methylthiotransferase